MAPFREDSSLTLLGLARGLIRDYLINMMTTNLTEAQFAAAQDKIDGLARSTRKGEPAARAAFHALSSEWEAAIALPQRTAQQRQDRLAAIAAVAAKHSLI